MEFTSQIELKVIYRRDNHTMLRLHAPMFAWVYLPTETLKLDGLIHPIFYFDPDGDTLTTEDRWYLRGATETLCEQAWEVYSAVRRLNSQNLHQILPMNLMRRGTIHVSDQQLTEFVATNMSHWAKEVRMISEGYQRVLAEPTKENS